MITKEEKIILDYLSERFSNGSSMVDCFDIVKDCSLPQHEVESAVVHLHSEDYLRLKQYKGGAFIQSLTHKGYHYQEFESASQVSQTNIFNAPVSGSAISSTGSIVVNNGLSFEEAKDLIQSKALSEEDRAEIEKLVTYIETLAENESPLKKGFLSKFGDTIQKHSWLPELVAKLLFQYLTGQ